MEKEEALLIALLVTRKRQLQKHKQKKRKHSVWVRKILTERSWKGEYHHLVKELKLHDHEFFYKQFRMSPTRYEELLQLVSLVIQKSSLKREAISPSERLCITLRFLCSGDSNVTIACSYRVGIATVGKIVKETCVAIWEKLLENNYIKAPNTVEEWLKVANRFESDWNFPNCVGAIDGKHILIQAPPRSGSSYFNYKKTHSIVLLAVCNANYEFTLVDIGDSGRESDGSIFAASSINRAFNNNVIHFPEARKLPRSDIKSPYVIVGDEAFPLRCHLVKPYARAVLDDNKRVYNYRLSRARRVIENAFGIMASRFRVFRRPIASSPENVKNITKAAVALHNFLLHDNGYFTTDLVDTEARRGQLRQGIIECQGLTEITRIGSNNYTGDAKIIRDNFCEYFNSPSGSVPWKREYIHKTIDTFDQQ